LDKTVDRLSSSFQENGTQISDRALCSFSEAASRKVVMICFMCYQCKLVDMPIREEAESSPDGYASPPSEGTRVAVMPSIGVAQRPVPVDISQKRGELYL
jgi:hypothetical protein